MFTRVAEVTFVPLCDLYRHVTRDTCVADVTFVPALKMVRCVVSPNLSRHVTRDTCGVCGDGEMCCKS